MNEPTYRATITRENETGPSTFAGFELPELLDELTHFKAVTPIRGKIVRIEITVEAR